VKDGQAESGPLNLTDKVFVPDRLSRLRFGLRTRDWNVIDVDDDVRIDPGSSDQRALVSGRAVRRTEVFRLDHRELQRADERIHRRGYVPEIETIRNAGYDICEDC